MVLYRIKVNTSLRPHPEEKLTDTKVCIRSSSWFSGTRLEAWEYSYVLCAVSKLVGAGGTPLKRVPTYIHTPPSPNFFLPCPTIMCWHFTSFWKCSPSRFEEMLDLAISKDRVWTTSLFLQLQKHWHLYLQTIFISHIYIFNIYLLL